MDEDVEPEPRILPRNIQIKFRWMTTGLMFLAVLILAATTFAKESELFNLNEIELDSVQTDVRDATFNSEDIIKLERSHPEAFAKAKSLATWLLSRGAIKQRWAFDPALILARGILVGYLIGSDLAIKTQLENHPWIIAAVAASLSMGFQYYDARYTDWLELKGWTPWRIGRERKLLPEGQRPAHASFIEAASKEFSLQLFYAAVMHFAFALSGFQYSDGTLYSLARFDVPLKIAVLSLASEGIWYALRAQIVGHHLRLHPELEERVWKISKVSALAIAGATSILYSLNFTPSLANLKATGAYLAISGIIWASTFGNYKKIWAGSKTIATTCRSAFIGLLP